MHFKQRVQVLITDTITNCCSKGKRHTHLIGLIKIDMYSVLHSDTCG